MPKHNITNEEKKQLFQRRLNGEAADAGNGFVQHSFRRKETIKSYQPW